MFVLGRNPTAVRWTVGLCFALAAPANAQQGVVSGRITDEGTRQPVGAVWVQVIGTSIAAQTTEQGTYTIRLNPGSYQLRTVRVGYAAQAPRTVALRAGETATVDWVLKAAPYTLEGVVVTATGEQLSREIGNTVGKVDVAQVVQAAPVTNVTQVLSGRIAGVNVLQSNGTTGQGARIRVRGLSSVSLSNDPVVYIDGIRVASESPPMLGNGGAFIGGGRVSHLNDLNPEEIESIEVVKGPSAATLYGTQAANGVIRITTKRGRVGSRQWNVWLEGGLIKDITEYPSTWFSKAVGSNTAACLPYQQALGQCQIERLHKLSLLEDSKTTPFGTGNRSQAGASVSGGTEAIRYFVSADYERELGVAKMPDLELDLLRTERGTRDIPFEQRRPNELNMFSGRINLSATPTAQLNLNVSSAYIDNDIRLPQTGDNFQSIINSALTGSANPALYAATGGYGFSRPADALGEVTWRRNTHYINSGTATWQPRSWLTARSTVGLDYLAYTDEQNVLNGQGCRTCATPTGSVERQGKRLVNRWAQSKYSVDVNATASARVTQRVGSKTSVGAQFNYDRLFGVLAEADVLPPGALTVSAGAQKVLNEQTQETKTIGQYVEQQFSLDDRLFLVGALRVDANSAFGRDSRSAVYPKVSASWVTLEGRRGWLNDLRLRAAYGQSGLQPTPLAAVTYDSAVTASIFGGANTPGAILGASGDPKLKPERSSEIEGGADVGLVDNRVRLGVTLYDKTTKDALVNRNLALSLGATATRIENIGTVNNKGIEVSLNARVIDRPSLGWDLQLEVAGNRNRLKSLGPGVPPLVGFGFKNIPNYPLFGLWWQNLKSWRDANGDGFIDPTEVVVSDTLEFLGSTVPTRTATLSNTVAFLNNRVRLGMLAEYKGGYVSHNVNTLFSCAFQRNCRALHDPNTSLEDQARAIAGPRAFGAYGEDATFVRLREVSLSYDAPPALARYVRAQTATLSLSARNVALWTRFNSWDPENVTQSTDQTNYNFGQQPQPLFLVLRLNLGL
jgi:TonB-linked SusC/RagA family outer membrane protein